MKKSLQKYSTHLICGLVLLTTVGCVPLLIGAVAGAGGMTYVKGALVKTLNHSVSDVHKSAINVTKDLKLFVTSDELNRHSAIIRAEFNDGKKLKITLNAITERTSKVTIRVGAFGDLEMSQIILNAIQRKL